MTNSLNNGNYSRLSVDPTLGGMVDEVDFPHSGLFKALAVGVQGNYAILNAATSSTTENFSIVQTDSSGNTQFVVGSGKVMRDGKAILVPSNDATTTFTSGTPSTFDEPSSTGNGYFLLVVAANNTLAVRDNGNKETLNTVPQLTAGDIPIAMIRLSNGENSAQRLIQYFTTAKKENSVSIGYENSNAYTEVGTLTGDANGITMTGLHKLDTLPTATAHGANSKVIIQDGDNSNTIRTITAQSIADLAPQGDITGITAGTGLTGTDLTGPVPTLNVGGLTVAELAANSLQTSGESFANNDTSLMTSASIEDKILSYGYTTNVGDITGVDLTDGAGIDIASETNTASGDYSATINLDLTEVIATDSANRVLTSDGDGTLTAQAELLVVEGLVSIEKALALGASGVTQYDGTTSLLVVDASSNSNTITLPAAASIESRVLIIKNIHTSNLTVTTQTSDKFEDNRVGEDYRQTDVNNLKLRPLESVMLYAISDSFSVDGSALSNGYLIIDREYEHPNHTGEVTSSADGATVIASNVVDEDNLKVSNTPTNGYFLQAQSGAAGGLTWAAVSSSSGDIEGITTASNSGLAGGATTGTPSLSLDINNLTAEAIASGDTIAFNDSGDNGIHKESIDDIATLFAGDGLTASSAVIAVNVDDSTIETNSDAIRVKNSGIDSQHIADNAVDGDKLADNIDIAGTLDVTGVTTLDDNLVVAPAKTLLARRLPVVALNASTTLTEADHAGRYVFIIGGSRVITLPDNQGAGVHFTIINNDGNGFTLRTGTNSSSGDNMNGAQTDIAVAARNGVTCISTGTDYVVLGV